MNEASYETILQELLEERASIDRMIAWVQGKMSAKLPEGSASTPPWTGLPNFPSLPLKSEVMRFPRLRDDQFFKMRVPEAIRAYLNIVKRPQTAREITEGLKIGGFSHRAKNLYQTVFPTLQRMKDKGEVDKLGNGEWGLSDWYGSGRRTEPDNTRHEPEK